MNPMPHTCVQGRREPATPPAAAPAANTVVAECTPCPVWAQPRCAGCQALSLHGAGGVQVCARSPCPGLGLCWQQGASFLPSQQYRCQQQGEVGGCPVLPMGQGVTAGLVPWGQGGDAEAGSTSTGSAQGQHGDGHRLDDPDEGVCSRDHFAMMVVLLPLGRD